VIDYISIPEITGRKLDYQKVLSLHNM